MIETFLHDLRQAVRQLRRTGYPAIVVVATLAISIAAATTLFSLVNAIVLRPLPVRDPDRLVALTLTDQRGQGARQIEYATYSEFAAHQPVFETVCAHSGGGVLTLDARGTLVNGGIAAMTPECLTLLGVDPLLGRLLQPDDAPGAGEPARVVVLGHRLWRQAFNSDPAAIGQPLVVEGMPLTIVGVLSPEFPGLHVDGGSDFYVPLPLLVRILGTPKRSVRALNLIGRLRPGVSLEQARAVVQVLWPEVQSRTIPPGLTSEQAADVRAQRVLVEAGGRGFSPLRTKYASPLVSLMGLAALLLLIGCVNLSGLLLARAVAGRREMAVRLALGATRFRVVRALLIENLLLTMTSALVALPLAWAASRGLGSMLWSSTFPLAKSMTPDARVLAVTGVVAIAAALLVSALAVLALRWIEPQLALRTGGATAPIGRLGKALVIVQVALSLVLLFGAGLFATSLTRLRSLESGFREENLVFARAWQLPGPPRSYDEQTYYPALVERLSAIPGVRSVALSQLFPGYFNFSAFSMQAIAPANAIDSREATDALTEFVSPRFFDTVGGRIVKGRDITWGDRAGSPAVVVINQALAQKLFPAGNAIGQRIRIGVDPRRQSVEVIGVATDITVGNLRAPHLPVVFRPRLQEPQNMRVPIVVADVSGDPHAAAAALGSAIASLGQEYTRDFSTIEDHLGRVLLQERLLSGASTFFAALAALLASLGIYGLLSHALASRTREIGVRMAIGATPGRILAIFLREGLTLSALGVLVGIPCALYAARITVSLLFGVEPMNVAGLAAVAAMLLGVAFLSALLPARRASRVDAVAALRSE